MQSRTFHKVIDLSEIPSSWELVRFSADWNGSPLLLYVEGKPAKPDPALISADPWVFTRWYQTRPKAHHVVYLAGGSVQTLCFDRSQGLSTFHVQRLNDGWLLGDRRHGTSTIYDALGSILTTIDLGDASEDMQTTTDGEIWVSYFDEGVFGGGIGRQGVVCFDSSGRRLFEYEDFAEKKGLPSVADCYAMNVTASGDVWLNYYTDFPLVQLRNFSLHNLWREFGSTGKGFAVEEDFVVYENSGKLFSKPLEEPYDRQSIKAQNESGGEISSLPQSYLGWAFRNERILLNTGTSIYASTEKRP